MSLTRRIAHNTIVQVSGKIISTLLGLAVIALMTRYLGQEGFGQYAIIMAFLQFFGILVDFGLTLVTLQMISEPASDPAKITSNIFTLRFFSALVFLGLAPLVVLFFPYPAIIKLGVAITTLSFFFISLNQILVGLFQKYLRMDRVALAEIAGRTTLLILVFFLVRFDLGLLAIMAAIVLGSFVNFAVSFIFSLKYVHLRFQFDFVFWAEIIRRAWPIGLSIVFNLVYLKADTIILSLMKSQAEVGIYSAPYRVIEVLVSLPIMFVGLILPVLTHQWASGAQDKFKQVLQKSFDVLSIVTVPMVVGTLFLARPLMILLAGEDFVVSGSILKILVLAGAVMFLATLFAHTVVAIQKQKLMIWGYFLAAVLGLIWYFIFIPRYSYWGAAWGTVFTESLIGLATFLLVWHTTKFLPSFRTFTKACLASLVMALVLYFLAGSNLFLLIFIAGGVYLVILYLLRGFSQEIVKEIIKVKS